MFRSAIVVIACGLASISLAQELDYTVTDPGLKVVRLDTSADDSFLSVRLDTEGRIFVGGRKTLFAYDLDAAGNYQPRKLLFEFPDHTWVNDIEIRGDDLYVVTVSALYRLRGARVKREGVTIERLLWGVPNGHVHQCFHACAWGPEGDLYVSMGDPLWYYGDFSRPDHWGHWTMFFKPSPGEASSSSGSSHSRTRIGTKEWQTMPYNGVGGVFRIRPDGSDLHVVSRGLRNPCGLCFDKDWNLFTNDNDHEGIPSLYAPGRLLHVTEGSYFSWPRGWLQSKTPDRADLLPSINDEMGRAVPVLQTCYLGRFLGAKYENSLMVARWCRRQVSYFPLEAKGKTFKAKEHVLLEGRDQARPVGVCAGRGGRLFVTICHMAQNEGSPTYRSELAVITRADDSPRMPFDPLDLTKAEHQQLSAIANQEASANSVAAYQELLRRAEGSTGSQKHDGKQLHQRFAPEASYLKPGQDLDADLEKSELMLEKLSDPADEAALPDRQICLRLAGVSSPRFLAWRCRHPKTKVRMGGVLTAGFRLTIPPVDASLPAEAPLAPQQKEEANIIAFADEQQPLDLRKFGRVGNYTVAEHWKALSHTEEQEQLFALLVERLDDTDDKVRLQAAHFLSLLNDSRIEAKIASVTSDVQDRRLNLARIEHLKPTIWTLGPVPDAAGFNTVHSIETAAVDLGGRYEIAGKSFSWQQTNATSPDRPLYDFRKLFGPAERSSVYSFFRFETPRAQRMQLLVGSEDGVKIWQNGKVIFTNDVLRPLIQLDDVVPIDLQPGSNDILVRVQMRRGAGGEYLHFRHLGDVKLTIPDKPDGLSLAERLKSASTGAQPIDPKFLEVDWITAARSGDSVRGRKLFAAESLGCAKCHAAAPGQAGGGGPSLADSGKRFTVPYLVESVLAPSKVISPVFKSTRFELKDGRVLIGLVISENGEQSEILTPDTKRIVVRKADVEERQAVDVSAMPTGLVKTPDELRDVIAYLISNPSGDSDFLSRDRQK